MYMFAGWPGELMTASLETNLAVDPAGGATNYGYFYNTLQEEGGVHTAVTFNSNGPMSAGVSHVPGTSTITVNHSGDYEIHFSVVVSSQSPFTLYVNGGLVPGSTYGAEESHQQVDGQVIVSLSANDTIELRSDAPGPITLESFDGISAGLLIQELT
jgi:hypothetical protein